MAESDTKSGGHSQKRGVAGSLTKKLLAPIVATAASALARYAAKNAPRILEETVLPKLREARRSVDGGTPDLPARARAAAGAVGDLAQDLAGRVSGGDDDPEQTAAGRAPTTLSRRELTERREARAERRTARRRTSTT